MVPEKPGTIFIGLAQVQNSQVFLLDLDLREVLFFLSARWIRWLRQSEMEPPVVDLQSRQGISDAGMQHRMLMSIFSQIGQTISPSGTSSPQITQRLSVMYSFFILAVLLLYFACIKSDGSQNQLYFDELPKLLKKSP